ncbi:MAG: MFS transporter [Candidatus Methanodesulfokora washburnensis]
MRYSGVLLLLSAVYMIGMATGVQRTILSNVSIQLSGTNALFVFFLPLISFGFMKGLMGIVSSWIIELGGSRKSFIAGGVLYILGVTLLVTSRDITSLFLGNIFVGSGEGIVHSTAYCFLSSERRSAGAKIGSMESSVYFGYGTGALLAGVVASYLGLLNSFLISLLSSLTSTIIMANIRENRFIKSNTNESHSVYIIGLKSKTLIATYITAHASKMSDSVMWGFYPIILSSLGFSMPEIGLAQAVIMVSFSGSMPLAGKLSDAIGRRGPLLLGLIMNIIGLIGVATLTDHLLQLVISAVFGIGLGLYYPILPAMTADSVPEEARSKALGLYRGFRDSGYATGAMLAGIIASYSLKGIFFVMSLLLLLVFAISMLVIKETRPIWATYELHLHHTDLLVKAASEFEDALNLLHDNKIDMFEEKGSVIKDYERKADWYRREMDRVIYDSVLSRDREDLLKLASRTDRSIAYILGAFRRLNLAKDRVPDSIRDKMPEMGRKIREGAELLRDAVSKMRDDPENAIKLLEELDKLEHDYDVLHNELLAIIVREREILDPVSAIMLMYFIEFCESSVDLMQDAGDVIRLIISKHAIWPSEV